MTDAVSFSIITACFNSQETIEDAILSLKNQCWKKVEHLVIDGASQDATLDIVKSHLGEKDLLISERDHGIYDALNKGVSLARGDVIGFLHSDDFYAHRGVISQVAACFDDPKVDAVYGDLEYVDAKNIDRVVRRWKSGHFSVEKLKRGWMPPHPTFFMRRSCYQELGGFDLSYRIASDYDALLRYLGGGRLNVKYLPSVLVKMRLGGASNANISAIIQKSKEDIKAMSRHGLNPWLALPCKNIYKLPQFF